ncbi:MAG: 8-amino-7-oxononanoate synthase [Acinetobacter sp.]|nr:8-amino-7-oxononanoate synthase [Acinetobacter sp.]
MNLLDDYAVQLEQLKQQNNFRQFYPIQHDGDFIHLNQRKMLNLASNDYLGIASDGELKQQFFDDYLPQNQAFDLPLTSSSSRLLTGNFAVYRQLEQRLSDYFGRSALLFNSGYHMNLGILPAVANEKTLILADKLIHASLIDGILLSKAKYIRYPHQNLAKLQQLIEQYHDDYQRIIIVTESIFSMDGDETDLNALVALKRQFSKIMLYVDDAHAIGVRGERGLGCAEQYGVLHEIDFLAGTFGKAMASQGGYVICHEILRQYLINFMRPLIFSTALPPLNIAWTDFVLQRVVHDTALRQKREYLQGISQDLIQTLHDWQWTCPSSSHIVPIILGENSSALEKAQQLQSLGYYVMAVRHPTVAKNQARLRICLNANVNAERFAQFKHTLADCLQGVHHA